MPLFRGTKPLSPFLSEAHIRYHRGSLSAAVADAPTLFLTQKPTDFLLKTIFPSLHLDSICICILLQVQWHRRQKKKNEMNEWNEKTQKNESITQTDHICYFLCIIFNLTAAFSKNWRVEKPFLFIPTPSINSHNFRFICGCELDMCRLCIRAQNAYLYPFLRVANLIGRIFHRALPLHPPYVRLKKNEIKYLNWNA